MSNWSSDSKKSKKIVYIHPKVWYNIAMSEKKSNIIPFPTMRRLDDLNREIFYAQSNQYDDCVELARYCLNLMQTGVHEQDLVVTPFNFDPESDAQQYTDMFVILNLLVASFLRNVNIKHVLQDDLDDLLTKIRILEDD